ncbi:MAG: U32 family peptidase [Paludibacter sp.]|nr:U32 family peptidase [Bacteroidales bacterium]MCM1069455.1 U32 family peptidase [Prevotella sp.]MCM1353829.1 U32 family peptidase [Bacteroides sp.]MCM1442771.1 U32 family peptidase [Muribaculum sp.]MCM1481865.1 U32 family peptidase [Paludibacter sp.]
MSATPATPIELLAPARNLPTGKAAIDCGADAVYIGAPQFGARHAAGNTIEDIRTLCEYAHQFDARVWVTLNTLLRDEEIPAAEQFAWDLYNAGADGLIVQDMGLLLCELPPIRLHASTQCNNTTAEKVKWLQDVGFERVVLARELSLHQIKAIREVTSIELEAFVHGALCVSYSGQCYLSESLCGRSANRGECAQLCRLKYDLLDKDGRELAHGKHALSLHDMDRSRSLRELLDAGITSLKIEGRLKSEDYVRNIVAYYRQALDTIFENSSSRYCRASKGDIQFGFTPNPAKTFHRGETDYFLHERTTNLANWETPKSTGEYIGKVIRTYPLNGKNGSVCIETDCRTTLHNGDGLCQQDQGFLINRAEEQKIYPNKPINIPIGTSLYRNYDCEFSRQLAKDKTRRRIPVDILLAETTDGFRLQIGEHTAQFIYHAEPAQKADQAAKNIRTQLSKLGDSIYEAKSVTLRVDPIPFIPAGVLNEWRRETLQTPLVKKTLSAHSEKRAVRFAALPAHTAHDYRLNILNKQAKAFYALCGVAETADAFEITHTEEARLMTCKYCLLYESGMCRKQQKQASSQSQEPVWLRTENGKLLRLHFDCAKCEMSITAATTR